MLFGSLVLTIQLPGNVVQAEVAEVSRFGFAGHRTSQGEENRTECSLQCDQLTSLFLLHNPQTLHTKPLHYTLLWW